MRLRSTRARCEQLPPLSGVEPLRPSREVAAPRAGGMRGEGGAPPRKGERGFKDISSRNG
eukprot:scaffold180921_cov40-Tisochrysis_lutea.AAC.1